MKDRYILLSVLAILTTIAIGHFKMTFYCWDAQRRKFEHCQQFWDDGGYYASQFHVFQKTEWFEQQPWYNAIKTGVTQKDLLQEWGQYAPRVKTIVTPHAYEGWFMALNLVKRFTGSLNDAFSDALLLFPILLLIKYILLISVVLRGRSLAIPILANLLFDVYAAPAFQTTQPFMLELLFFGFTTYWFGRRNRASACLTGGSFLAACSFTPLAIPGILAFLLGVLTLRHPPALKWVKKNYFNGTLALAAGVYLISAVYLVMNLKHGGAGVGKFSGAIRIFDINSSYFSPLLLGLFFALKIMIDYFDGFNFKGLIVAVSSIWWITLGLIVLVAIAPFISVEMTFYGGNRFSQFMLCFLLMGLFSIADNWKNTKARLIFSQGTFLLLVSYFLVKFVPTPYLLDFPRYLPLTEDAFPSRHESPSKKPYYLAKGPQQVYGYFLRSYYEEAPLILDLELEKYSKSKIIKEL